MSLVVNKNLSAMSAHRYLKLNDASFSKSVERLSSGMKINRAADDPAGLVISEKYRAQVEGLNQAIKNANDGISLVQTAEGALDEVTTALRSMRNLALHAANTGASDSSALAADQAQIEEAIATINRIANNTSFGGRKLLDGSSGVTGTTTDSDVTFISGTEDTVSGTYGVAITTQSKVGIHNGDTRTAISTVAIDTNVAAATGNGTLQLAGTILNGQTVSVSYTTGQTYTEIAANLKTALDTAGFSDMTVAFNGADTMTITANRLGLNTDTDLTGIDATKSFSIADSGSDITEADTVVSNVAIADSMKFGMTETITFKNGEGGSVNVSVLKGTTIAEAVSDMNDQLDAAGFDVAVSYSGGKIILTNENYGDNSVVKYSVASTLANSNDSGSGVVATAGADINIALGGGGGTAGVNVAGTINGVAATSIDGVYLRAATGDDSEGILLRTTGGAAVGGQGSVIVDQNSLTFQVGAFDSETVKVGFDDMRSNKLGTTATGISSYTATTALSGLDVTTGNGQGAQDAIRIIDAAIDQVTSMRSEMGSFQKDVLESTVRNLTVASQNMSASESAIRDADMAEEMLSFSRAQILQQTGMSMLAQANQAPQAVMKLFS